MQETRLPVLMASGIMAIVSGAGLFSREAIAAPSNSLAPGAAQAAVITPIRIVAGNSLRFGQIAQPSTAGTMAIATNGTVAGTGGMTTSYAIAQTGTGIGAASFTVTGDANRSFALTLPNRITIRNGGARMRITALVTNTTAGIASLNGAGSFTLNLGGTLNVAANQALGNYTGTYNVTVTYQ